MGPPHSTRHPRPPFLPTAPRLTLPSRLRALAPSCSASRRATLLLRHGPVARRPTRMLPFMLCLPMSTAPPRHGPHAPMCPHGWLPSPHLLSPPALSDYPAQANTCQAYLWLSTHTTTRPGLDPAPNRACAHNGPTRAAVHLPQRIFALLGQTIPGRVRLPQRHVHHTPTRDGRSPLEHPPLRSNRTMYPMVPTGVQPAVPPGGHLHGTTWPRGDHSRARTHRHTGALNEPLDHTVPQQAPRGRTPTHRARRRWGGSTPTTLLLSVWGCEWGSTPLGSYPQPHTNRVGEDASSISRTGRRPGWLWNLRPVNWWSNPKRPKEPDGNAPGRLAEFPSGSKANHQPDHQRRGARYPWFISAQVHKASRPRPRLHTATRMNPTRTHPQRAVAAGHAPDAPRPAHKSSRMSQQLNLSHPCRRTLVPDSVRPEWRTALPCTALQTLAGPALQS